MAFGHKRLLAHLVQHLARPDALESSAVLLIQLNPHDASLVIKEDLSLVILVDAAPDFPASAEVFERRVMEALAQERPEVLERISALIHVVVLGGRALADWPNPMPHHLPSLGRSLLHYQVAKQNDGWQLHYPTLKADSERATTVSRRIVSSIETVKTLVGSALESWRPESAAVAASSTPWLSPSPPHDAADPALDDLTPPDEISGAFPRSSASHRSIHPLPVRGSEVEAETTRQRFRQAEVHGERELVRETLSQRALETSTPRLSYGLIGLCAVIFGFELWFGDSNALQTLVRMGAMQDRLVDNGQWWRLITYGYLHGGFEHILSNCFGLMIYGVLTERLLGPSRFIVLMTLSILGGGLAGRYLAEPGTWMVGISGGVFGLLVAVLMLSRKNGYMPNISRQGLFSYAVVMLVVNLIGSLVPGVSMAGHVGGLSASFLLFASGFITWGLPKPWESQKEAETPKRFFQGLATLCVGITLYSFVQAAQTGRPWELARPQALVPLLLPVNVEATTTQPADPLVSVATDKLPTTASTRPETPIRVSLPPSLLRTHTSTREPPWTEHSFGDPYVDPIVVVIMLKHLEEDLPPDTQQALLLRIANEFNADETETAAESNVTRYRSARVVTVNGKAMITFDKPDKSQSRPRYVLIEGPYLVDLMFSVAPDFGDAWLQQTQQIAASVERVASGDSPAP